MSHPRTMPQYRVEILESCSSPYDDGVRYRGIHAKQQAWARIQRCKQDIVFPDAGTMWARVYRIDPDGMETRVYVVELTSPI